MYDSIGFFMNNLKKWYESIVFFREITFFWQNMGTRAECFSENRRFLTKSGLESSYFFVKNLTKRASYWLFGSIIEFSFDRINVFDQIWAWQHGVFHEIVENMTPEHSFLREWTFFLNMDLRAVRFFEKGRFIYKIWEWEQKGHPIDFFVQNIL